MNIILFPQASHNLIARYFEWLMLHVAQHVAISAVEEDFIDFNMLNLKELLNPLSFQLIVNVISVTTNCV